MGAPRWTGLFFAGLITGTASFCQPQLLFDRLGDPDGLPGNEIYALLEDRDGMVWVGTESGLARLEGTRTRVWQHDPRDAHSLSSQIVHAIAQDMRGGIWVATAHGFERFRPGRNDFEVHHIPSPGPLKAGSDRIYDLVPDRHGSLWLINDNGLWCYSMTDGSIHQVFASTDPHAGPFSTRMNGTHSLSLDTVLNGLWCSTRDGLAFLDLTTKEWYGPGHDPQAWNCFTRTIAYCPISDGNGGVWWYDLNTFELVHNTIRSGECNRYGTVNGEPMQFGPQWMALAADGTLWISTWTYRCLHFHPYEGRWDELRSQADGNDPTRLRSTNVKSFLEDRNGTLWFGTWKGLDVAMPERQVLQISNPALPNHAGVITAIGVVGSDSLLLGTGDGQLFMHSGHVVAPVHFPEGRPERIHAITRRDGDRFWVAGLPGPWCYDKRNGSLLPWKTGPPSLGQASITDMLTDNGGNTWACTWENGLFVHHPDGGSAECFHDTLEGAHWIPWRSSLALLELRNGDVLVGLNNSGGLCRFPRGRPPLKRYLAEEAGTTSSCGVVLCLAATGDGAVWAGTHEGGVARVDLATGRTSQFTRSDGLPSNRVNSLLVDRQGVVWALTDRGLAFLRPGLHQFLPQPMPAGLDVHGISSGLAELTDGEICFAIGQLLVHFNPLNASKGPAQVKTQVMAIATNDTTYRIPGNHEIELPAERRGITVEWGTNDPLRGRRASFAYRILPDITWTPVGHAGRVDINGLTPGVHRVEIHAGFDGRSWGPSAFSPVIHVLPPFQDRWWFRALVALVLLTIGWLSTRLYVNRRLAAQRMLFERQQAVLTERMRIAGDMHDDLGVGLSVLKMRSEMALRHEADAAKKSQLQALASTAGELIVNMRHIIWTLNTDQASVEDLMVYITSHVRNSLSEVKITLDMQANGPWPTLELSSEQRRNILLLVKEVLNNILKHARAQHVKFRAKAEGDRLLITITDDGIGMNGNGNGDGGNGLRNMDRRMATLGGKLSISGGTGTTVHMDIPLHGPEAPNKGSIAPGP